MTKRLIASLGLILCLCCSAWAINQELTVKLDNNNRKHNKELGVPNIIFDYVSSRNNKAVVKVSVENMTSEYALIFFGKNFSEEELKKGKPKIEFVKKFGGNKGERSVSGNQIYSTDYKDYIIIPAGETENILTIEIPFSKATEVSIPFYQAKYNAGDLYKKNNEGLAGQYHIPYKLLKAHQCNVSIEVAGWTEEDSVYVGTKKAVDNFISSLEGVKFCTNDRHSPSLKGLQLPYQEKKDSLTQVIKDVIDSNGTWMSDDAPHIAYSRLWAELSEINLDSMTYDCGEHKGKGKDKIITGEHTCSFCPLSAQAIYQRLDDLYQQLYAGNINKNQALNTAYGLYNCYQKNKKRKKDKSYGDKISKFYNRIANY